MKQRVAIVDDEKFICESIASLINKSLIFECIHLFGCAEDAIHQLPDLDIDIVLMDIHLPGKNGIDCIELLKPHCPNTLFIILTSVEDAESVFRALKAGAIGYLTKTTKPSKILDALVEAQQGGSPMSSHIARQVVNSFQQNEQQVEMQKLSKREKEILDLLAQGFRYKEIAGQIFLSLETVRTHVRNIYDKLQVNSRTEALNKVYKH